MFEGIKDPALSPIFASAMTISFGLVTLYFRWLTGSFKKLNLSVTDLSNTISKWLSEHEDLDQARHEQNLARFERISVSLARMGSDNGLYAQKEI